MKKLNICLLFASLLFVSCKDDAQVVNEATLPQAAKEYLITHFSSISVSRVVRERDDKKIYYDVRLQNHIEIEFDESGKIIAIEARGAGRLPDSVIPPLLLEYVNIHYPNDAIVEWEIDSHSQEIQLSNDVELIFDLNGGFQRIDH